MYIKMLLLRPIGNPIILTRQLGQNYGSLFAKKVPPTAHQYLQQRHVSQSSYANYFNIDLPPIKCAYTVLDTIHNSTGLPWWATIMATTFFLRTFITLPIFMLVMSNTSKWMLLQPLVIKLSKEMREEAYKAQRQYGWTKKVTETKYKQNLKRLHRKLYTEYNCHPAKSLLLPWFQIPIWLSISMALRNMSIPPEPDMPVLCPDMALEGTLWFQNLLIPDIPLSLTFSIINFLLIEHFMRKGKMTKMIKVMGNISRVFNIIMLPIALSMPSNMTLYWTCSSFYGLMQGLIFSDTKLKKKIAFNALAEIEMVTKKSFLKKDPKRKS